VRQPLWNDRREAAGPFDIIGDVHGCFDELRELLIQLGYGVEGGEDAPAARHPAGRKAVFLGDLVDRGPKTPAVLRLVMGMVAAGEAFCIPGNHEAKLKKWLDGRQVQVGHGLAESIAQLEREPEAFRSEVRTWIDELVSHYVLDGGHLVFLSFEAVRRRPLSDRTMEISQKVGIAILGTLMVFVFYNDIIRLVKRWLAS